MQNIQGLIHRGRKGRREKIKENISQRPTQTHTDGWAEREKIHRRDAKGAEKRLKKICHRPTRTHTDN